MLPFPLFPVAIVALVLLTVGHVPFLVIPLVFFFIVRPIMWGSGYGFWCGPRWGRGPSV